MHAEPAITWTPVRLEAGAGLGPHAADWDRLNQQLHGGHALLDSSYVNALLAHFPGEDLHLACASRGGAVVAMMLLKRQARRLGLWSSYLPSQAQVGPSLLPQDVEFRSLYAALPGTSLEVDLLCNDPRLGDLRALRGGAVKALPHALTMSVSLAGHFDDYWALRPRKLIQNMRRYLRRLQAEPQPERLEVVTAAKAMPAAVARYAELESSGWKGRQGTAVGMDNSQGRFYAEVMQAFAASDEALIYELWLGEDLIASRMVLCRDGMAIMLKTAFHEQFERFAPGRILLLRTLEDLFRRLPGGVVEFYTDAEADLLAWSTSQRWINHISVYRYRALPALYGLLRRSARRWRGHPDSRIGAESMAERSGSTVARFDHPRELPEDAVALLQRREQAYVEFGADWFGLLTDTVFRAPSQVALYVLRRNGRTLAVLPIARQQDADHEVGALANYYTTLFSPLLEDDLSAEDLLPLMLALRRDHPGMPAYGFRPLDPQTREYRLLRDALHLAGLQPKPYFAFGNWYLRVNGDWPTYLRNRSGPTRSTIERMGRRLAAEPSGRLEILRDAADVERGIAAYQAVYSASWKVPEPYADFIPELIRLCARRGWLRLGLAWIGDKPIAAQLWIVHAGRAHIYKMAYDEAFKAFAPGTLLTARLMEEAIDRDRVEEVDYLIGDDAYKKTWMSHRRERVGLIAYDPTTVRGLFGLLRHTVGDAWQQLRKHRAATSLPADNPAS